MIAAEFFDVNKSRSVRRGSLGQGLLRSWRSWRIPGVWFDAVVVGEPHRAYFGNQHGLTIPLFGITGFRCEFRRSAVQSVFGGMSKGERNVDGRRHRGGLRMRLGPGDDL